MEARSIRFGQPVLFCLDDKENTRLFLCHHRAGRWLIHIDRDFLLKPELLRAISDLGFEHPSEGLSYSVPGTCLILVQFSRNVYLRPSSAQMSFARPNLVWVRRPFSSLPPYSRCMFFLAKVSIRC